MVYATIVASLGSNLIMEHFHRIRFFMFTKFRRYVDYDLECYITVHYFRTEYSDLQRIKRELALLQKLYNLYNNVIENVNSYYDILWAELDIEKINSELLEFQNK